MFENTYVGKFWRNAKNSFPPPHVGGGHVGSRKPPKTARKISWPNAMLKKKFDFGFGFSTIKLGKEN